MSVVADGADEAFDEARRRQAGDGQSARVELVRDGMQEMRLADAARAMEEEWRRGVPRGDGARRGEGPLVAVADHERLKRMIGKRRRGADRQRRGHRREIDTNRASPPGDRGNGLGNDIREVPPHQLAGQPVGRLEHDVVVDPRTAQRCDPRGIVLLADSGAQALAGLRPHRHGVRRPRRTPHRRRRPQLWKRRASLREHVAFSFELATPLRDRAVGYTPAAPPILANMSFIEGDPAAPGRFAELGRPGAGRPPATFNPTAME